MLAHRLNHSCQCVNVDRARLASALESRGQPEAPVAALFAQSPVFIDDSEVRRIEACVEAVQRVVGLSAFREQALASAPEIAAIDQGTRGVLYGYDFHLTEAGPRLIEINTNAGGALLNVALAAEQRPCCDAVQPFLRSATHPADVEAGIVQSFRDEFARAGRTTALERIAIVDDDPGSQFLYPEFVLFQKLFRQHGMDACIVDPKQLAHRDGALWAGELRIDLVYNRLTDFYFEAPASRALREAYARNDVVVTPHPRAHALFADKRHLASFSDVERLDELSVDPDTRATLLETVPRAELVSPSNRERLWRERRRYFFKPLHSYGGKAAYRGDKLTRRTWEQISTRPYLAQETVKPSERILTLDGVSTPLKLDVRAYVDQGRVILYAARLYQGQTTNFRTPGGGFATVLATPDLLRV